MRYLLILLRNGTVLKQLIKWSRVIFMFVIYKKLFLVWFDYSCYTVLSAGTCNNQFFLVTGINKKATEFTFIHSIYAILPKKKKQLIISIFGNIHVSRFTHLTLFTVLSFHSTVNGIKKNIHSTPSQQCKKC